MRIEPPNLPSGIESDKSLTFSTRDTFSSESDSILRRTDHLSPEIRKGPEPEVLATFAGLRPSREGGARVERSDVVVDGVRRALVHNYGAGGTGYQAGYGMALDAVQSVDDWLRVLARESARL